MQFSITIIYRTKILSQSQYHEVNVIVYISTESRARICKRLRSPAVDSASLCSLAELIPWNRFLGSLNVYKFGLSCIERSGDEKTHRVDRAPGFLSSRLNWLPTPPHL
jgi:hypothetical protein